LDFETAWRVSCEQLDRRGKGVGRRGMYGDWCLDILLRCPSGLHRTGRSPSQLHCRPYMSVQLDKIGRESCAAGWRSRMLGVGGKD
jgi:hypothetical protein